MKSVSFKTVGCRLNQAETSELSELFAQVGFSILPFGDETDAVVIHTCAVTARAENNCIRMARSCRRKFPSTFIVLAGCAAEVSATHLEEECQPDLIVGQAGKFDLPKKLADIMNISQPDSAPSAPDTNTRAIVKVQTGCDFHCTYCIVPTARGNPASLSHDDIIDKIRSLADDGFKEVILTGANLGCYGATPSALVALLDAIEEIDGIKRVRLSSIEMTTTEEPLVEFMKQSSKVCRHLHIPLQSGSDSVLQRMRRKYSASEYLSFCEHAIEALPDLSIGTDIITGFPGETEEEFEETMNLVDQIPFSNMHIFQYSIREGTPAATMPMQVEATAKKSRADALLVVSRSKKATFAKHLIGKTCSVLIEGGSDEGIASGWTSEYIRAEISSQSPQINEIVEFIPKQSVDGILMDG